jgi:peptidoglycan/LPS O-acetylase OafA/YrhL
MLLDTQENRSIVDMFRAAGILLVICFHVVIGLAVLLDGEGLAAYLKMMPNVFNIFWQALGSEIVFLFSGFLLSYLLLREFNRTGRIDIMQFYVRRLSRILPLYIVAVAGYSLARDYNAKDLVLNLLFVSETFSARTIVPVAWSLELLMQSYILLPFVALAFLKSGRPIALCLASIFASLAARYFAFAADPASYQTPIYAYINGTELPLTLERTYELLPYRATPFLIGFLLAYLVIHMDAKLRVLFGKPAVAFGFAAMSVCLIVASGFLPLHDRDSVLYSLTGDSFWLWFWTAQRCVFSAGICFLVLCLWYGRTALFTVARRFASWRLWQKVSAHIYAIYLGHPALLIPAAVITFRTTDRHSLAPVNILEVVVTIVIAAILSLMLALVLTRYIEMPAQDWIRSKFRRSGQQRSCE